MNKLIKYGINKHFLSEAQQYPEMEPARVVSQYKDLYRVVTRNNEGLAEVSGKFRHEAAQLSDFPAVGDFVMVDNDLFCSGNGIIHHVLTRKSVFGRTAVGQINQVQIVAANIDIVFICMALNSDYNKSRLERYLAVAWDSGATPVVILTKSDLCSDLDAILDEVSTVAFGVDVITTSRYDTESYEKVLVYLKEGITGSFIGSSGVGKSTLINMFFGSDLQETSEIRQDGKGKHTTTRRELLVLPQGGIVIDTPGMRELGVDSVNLSKSFADIDALEAQCKFNDCTHRSEPGCAIRKAIESGLLEERRYESYLKLKKEARYVNLTSKQIETEKLNEMFGSVGGMKKARDFIKHKNKNRYN